MYDIETTPLLPWCFSLGKQVIRHNQLLKGYFSRTHIISIAYQWMHEDKAHVLNWGNSEADEKKMIEKIGKLIQEADIVIGKNSNRFDNKHVNTQRLWFGLEGQPEWMKQADDLEVQMRRHFYLPSYSLDYLSEQLGFGGKDKMLFDDWVAISEYRMLQLAGKGSAPLLKLLTGKTTAAIRKEGKEKLKKMCDYNRKDTEDTVNLWNYCAAHFQPKLNMARFYGNQDGYYLRCKICGGENIFKNGVDYRSATPKQKWHCRDCNRHAGSTTILSKGFGKMT